MNIFFTIKNKENIKILSGGSKRVLLAWNKTREKYMPEEKRQNLVEAERGSY